MVRNFAIALLAAAALSIAVPNTSEAGWVIIHGRYVWIAGTGSSTPSDAKPWGAPPPSRTERILTAHVHIRGKLR